MQTSSSANITANKRPEYSFVFFMFLGTDHHIIFEIFHQQRKNIIKFKKPRYYKYYFNWSFLLWYHSVKRSVLFLVHLGTREELLSFLWYNYMNWLNWNKNRNLKCYWKHAEDGNLFRKWTKVEECCWPVSQNFVVFWLVSLSLKFEWLSTVLLWPSENKVSKPNFQTKLILYMIIHDLGWDW